MARTSDLAWRTSLRRSTGASATRSRILRSSSLCIVNGHKAGHNALVTSELMPAENRCRSGVGHFATRHCLPHLLDELLDKEVDVPVKQRSARSVSLASTRCPSAALSTAGSLSLDSDSNFGDRLPSSYVKDQCDAPFGISADTMRKSASHSRRTNRLTGDCIVKNSASFIRLP